MKTKSLLIAVSFIALLFTSCSTDEMDKGIGAGDDGMLRSSIQILRSCEKNADIGVVDVRITSENNNIIFERNIDVSLEPSLNMNTSSLPRGIYYIDILGPDGKTIQQDGFVIQ
ncbi:hypothetical protein [Dysgonomonas sp. ZJ709]|uniref:hypothetical protein n=1 Tax=Dysgonomonas sp. ZJ709 TaxID=2709797 RepID=UPI0013EB881B|nr:hypothetical protein [Dysgonomonas sp. ZJ709]